MLQQNSRHIALLVASLLLICAPVAFGWLRLDVHPAVDLGTIDAGSFVGVTQGKGSFNPLQATGNVSIRLDDNNGSQGSQQIELYSAYLYVQLYSASPNVDITRFMWKGGVQDEYTTFSALDKWMRVARVSGSGTDWHTFKMSYRYLPSEVDLPGDHHVYLRFRLQLYDDDDGDGKRKLDKTIYHDVTISWDWPTLIILILDHMSVDLGTIGPDSFNPATGTWTPLTSGRKRALVFANVGFTLRVTAESATGFMPADLTRFKMIGGNLVNFTPLYPIPAAGLILATSDTGAFLKITNIQYQYVPCWRDAPGLYKVTVTYTVTAR